MVEHRFCYVRELFDRVVLIQDGQIVQTFSREDFCSLSDDLRIVHGFRTVWLERDIRHYQERKQETDSNRTIAVDHLFSPTKRNPLFYRMSALGSTPVM